MRTRTVAIVALVLGLIILALLLVPRADAHGRGGWAIPRSVVMCESGGDADAVNWRNPARPAGAYQIVTSTWHAYGGGRYARTADRAPLWAQHVVARRVLRGQGPGAWACW
jgi:hypothetical protein